MTMVPDYTSPKGEIKLCGMKHLNTETNSLNGVKSL